MNEGSYRNVHGRKRTSRVLVGKEIEQFRKEYKESVSGKQFISWSMPGHDLDRPNVKGCTFIKSSDGDSVVYTACPSDPDHHIKAKRQHCWSLKCPSCMNDTALKRAVAVERQFSHTPN